MRHDPILKLLAGQEDLQQPWAGKSTLNRLELGAGTPDRYKKITFWKQGIDELLADVFIEAHASAPEAIVLDIDTTDVALHGNQEGRFFHGYYDHYCYLPLYIFSAALAVLVTSIDPVTSVCTPFMAALNANARRAEVPGVM